MNIHIVYFTKRKENKMNHTFAILTKLPDLNSYIEAERSSRYKAAEMKKSATATCQWSCNQLRGKVDQCKRYHVSFEWHLPNRKLDNDNVCAFARKVILDGLVKAGVLKNDGANNIGNFKDEFIYDGKTFTVVTLIEEV